MESCVSQSMGTCENASNGATEASRIGILANFDFSAFFPHGEPWMRVWDEIRSRRYESIVDINISWDSQFYYSLLYFVPGVPYFARYSVQMMHPIPSSNYITDVIGDSRYAHIGRLGNIHGRSTIAHPTGTEATHPKNNDCTETKYGELHIKIDLYAPVANHLFPVGYELYIDAATVSSPICS